MFNNILRHYLLNHHVLCSPETWQQPLSLILNEDSDWPIRGLYAGHVTGIDQSEDWAYWQGVDVNVIFTLKMEEIRKNEVKKNKWNCILHCYGCSLLSQSHLCDQSRPVFRSRGQNDQPEDLWLCPIKPSDPVSVMSSKHKFCSVQYSDNRKKERDVFFSYGASISVILWNGQLKMREKERGSKSVVRREK